MATATIQGLCHLDEIHGRHDFDYEGARWRCPGQGAECRNCDGRKCMGCVTREHPHACQDDCPGCC